MQCARHFISCFSFAISINSQTNFMTECYGYFCYQENEMKKFAHTNSNLRIQTEICMTQSYSAIQYSSENRGLQSLKRT